jgi:tripartite-type tricarboxylate transporter receptor subunit TctC
VFAGFLKRSGLDMVRVPYRDPVQAVNDLSEGRIDMFLSALVTVRAQAQAGRVKLLALTNRERTQLLPDVPTAAQAGYPALTLDGLAGLFGTASLPAPVRERIAAEVRDIIANPEIAKRIADTGQIVSPGLPAEFTASIEEQSKTFAAIAELLGLKIAQQ